MQEMQDLTVGLKLKSEADTIKQELNTEADTIKRELKAWAAAELSEKCTSVDSNFSVDQLPSLSGAVESYVHKRDVPPPPPPPYVNQRRSEEPDLTGSEALDGSKPVSTTSSLSLPVSTSNQQLISPLSRSNHQPMSPLSNSSLHHSTSVSRSPLFVGISLQPIPEGDSRWSVPTSSTNRSGSEQHQQRQHASASI
eukprot:gnl/TRDRNA2_/TRDRNA2_169440_c1_seq6.p1 gnl/TRDRNA2_/TRDRNA2_169440_c1~~gnl/TRDRNA2_/TRDRNA2_169440_c1_seq6.p1  ORF type:complete len:196 (-),score=24.50 gnl/TRDRNA2_/TRDRNA2_169440_c1_seq6:210-797(-)